MLEMIFGLVGEVGTMNLAVLLVLLVIGIVLAMKMFSYLLKAVLTGIAFGIFPIVANYIGLPVPVTIASIVNSAIFGIVLYMAFSFIKMGYNLSQPWQH